MVPRELANSAWSASSAYYWREPTAPTARLCVPQLMTGQESEYQASGLPVVFCSKPISGRYSRPVVSIAAPVPVSYFSSQMMCEG